MLQGNSYRKLTLTHQSKVPPPWLQKVQHDISNSNRGIYFHIVTDKNAHLSCMIVVFGRLACYFAVLIFIKKKIPFKENTILKLNGTAIKNLKNKNLALWKCYTL